MEQQKHMFHPKYRPDIDGLRAIAVLSVVAFHAFPEWVKGGFIGVDIFFVISGFLISTIIFENLEKGTFRFAEFYARRAIRIFPALIIVMISSCLIGWMFLFDHELKKLAKHVMGGAGFLSNFILWDEAGYFDKSSESKPLLHLWSLGIEEQYYIFFPLTMWAAWKKGASILTTVLALAVGSFILNVYEIKQHDIAAAFYSPLSRCWELLCGSFLAWLKLTTHRIPTICKENIEHLANRVIYRYAPTGSPFNLSNVISILGVALLIFGFWNIDKKVRFPGAWALLPTISAALIISAGPNSWINRHLLSHKLIVWIGLISYPLYLWHWPLLSYLTILSDEPPEAGSKLLAVAAAITLAWLTYRYVETPIRKLKPPRPIVVLCLALSLTVTGLIGFAVYYGFADKYMAKKVADTSENFNWDGFFENKICRQAYPDFKGNFCNLMHDAPPTIALIGDSHGMSYNYGLAKSLNKFPGYNLVNFGGFSCFSAFESNSYSTGLPLGDGVPCREYMNYALSVAENTSSIKTVILGSRSFTMSLSATELEDYKSSLFDTISRLKKANKRVILLKDFPELSVDPETCIRMFFKVQLSHKCAFEIEEARHNVQQYESIMIELAKRFADIEIFDSTNEICPDGLCSVLVDGKSLYRDRDHLSRYGSVEIGNKLSNLIREDIQQ